VVAEPRIELKRDEALTAAERAAVDRWIGLVFGPQPYVISPMEWRVTLWLDDELVSHVGLIRRAVDVGGRSVEVGGFGWVGTLAERRLGGLASRAMRRAQEFARDELGVEFGLLVTSQRTAPFYEKLGWSIVPGPLSFAQPSGPVTWPGVAMAFPAGGAAWPGGPIDLRGLLW
jgi:hypothetical protein